MRTVRLLLVLSLILVGIPAAAQEPVEVPSQPALLQVRENGGLRAETMSIVSGAASLNGASVTVLDRVTLLMWSVRRAEAAIQSAPPGFGYPLLTAALDPTAPIVSDAVRTVLARGEAAMGELSASIRGAQVGDLLDLEPLTGGTITVRIGAIVSDRELFNSELMLAKSTALQLGIDRPFAIVAYGEAIDRVEASIRGSVFDPAIRIDGLVDDVLSDPVLSVASVKARFGEFAIRDAGGDQVEIDPAWVDANIVDVDLAPLGLFRCHRLVVPYLRGVVSELHRSSLIELLDPADFQLAGGCYNPRFNRGGDPGYSLSRHAWGIAIDLNPSSNPYGSVPTLPLAVVEVFRRWGFSWGGTWSTPDGMHFEWRQLPLSYSSTCADLTVMPLYAGGLWYLRPAEGDCQPR
ncbi:MAG TPA: M15 family metallopeptidase [Acidimicrobiia bacterium]|nr:M15 family metallopeptidase [Acidimicrobiia bacterium]